MTIRLYEVGGCVRDELLGLRAKDFDYAVEVNFDGTMTSLHHPEHVLALAYDVMRMYLISSGFEIFVESPEYGTIRARFPRAPITRQNNGQKARQARTGDFVLCRKDGPSSDGRRPDYVEVGTLADDLARRDFTVNAMARPVRDDFTVEPQAVIDPHFGLIDLQSRILRFVGDPMDRLREDGLRILRALRFKITKGFEFDQALRDALKDPEVPDLLAGVSVERRREELERCFQHDTLLTMDILMHDIHGDLLEAMFSGSLRLSATMRQDFVHAN